MYLCVPCGFYNKQRLFLFRGILTLVYDKRIYYICGLLPKYVFQFDALRFWDKTGPRLQSRFSQNKAPLLVLPPEVLH